MKNLENFQNDLIDSECLVGGEKINSTYEGGDDCYDTDTETMSYDGHCS